MVFSIEESVEKVDSNGMGIRQKIQIYFNVINHILISVVSIYMSFLCYSTGNVPISWHAWLCCIGYQLLMTQAIMAFYTGNVWTQYNSRKSQRYVHWILQAVGSSMAIAGMIIIFMNKISAHFHSTHSIIGLTAGILTLIGMTNGVSALWSIELRRYIAPVYLKCFHNFAGISAFVLGMVALFFGYDKGYMMRNSREDIRMCLQAVAIITILLSLIGALRSFFVQLKTVFTNTFA